MYQVHLILLWFPYACLHSQNNYSTSWSALHNNELPICMCVSEHAPMRVHSLANCACQSWRFKPISCSQFPWQHLSESTDVGEKGKGVETIIAVEGAEKGRARDDECEAVCTVGWDCAETDACVASEQAFMSGVICWGIRVVIIMTTCMKLTELYVLALILILTNNVLFRNSSPARHVNCRCNLNWVFFSVFWVKASEWVNRNF